MAAGDAAGAKGLHVYDGSENANELHVRDNERGDEIAAVMDDVAAATAALATKVNTSDVYSGTGSVFNKIPKYDGAGRLIAATPSASNHAAPKAYVDAAVAGAGGGSYVSKSGDTMSGDLLIPGASAATFSYTVGYINGDGRVSRGASSYRWKKNITRDCAIPDVFAAPLSSYQMRQDPDGVLRYGYIAEDLAAHEATQPFVVYDDKDLPMSYDMIGLLLAQVAQLRREIDELKGGA